MNYQNLNNFLVLVDSKSISKAAKSLYITQPALTKQIKSLEKEIGCSLLIRKKEGIELTKEGIIFYNYAKEVVEKTHKVMKDIQEEILNNCYEFRIAYSTTFQKNIIDNTVSQFYKNHNIEIDIIQQLPYEAIKMLNDEEINCAFVLSYALNSKNDLAFESLYHGGLSIRIASDDPLAKKEVVSIKDLKEYIWVQNELSDPKYLEYINNLLNKEHINIKVKKAKGKANVDLMASFDKHFAIVSDYNVTSVKTKLIPIKEIREGMDIGIIYKKDTINPLVKEYIDIVKKSL